MMKKFLFSFLMMSAGLLWAQDTCATAVAVTPGTYTVDAINGDAPVTVCAQNGEGQMAGEWYSYSNPATTDYHQVTVSTNLPQNVAPFSDDTRVHVYSGDCSTLACEAGADDVSNSNYLSEVTFLVPPSTTYIFVFDDRWSALGFDFEVTATPFTPDCTTALPFMEVFDNPGTFAGCYTVEDVDGNGTDWISQQNLDLDGDGTPETFATNGSNSDIEDDWLISPGFDLMAGVTYTLTAHFNGYGQAEPSTQDLTAMVLDAPSSTANNLQTIFTSTSITNGDFATLETNAIEETGTFTPTADGTYYFAFNATTTAATTNGFILFFDYSVVGNMGVNDINGLSSLTSVYPNPAVNKVNVKLAEKFDAAKTSVSVIDMNGKVVAKFNSVEDVNVQALPKGVYVMEISDGKNVENKKLIKK